MNYFDMNLSICFSDGIIGFWTHYSGDNVNGISFGELLNQDYIQMDYSWVDFSLTMIAQIFIFKPKSQQTNML